MARYKISWRMGLDTVRGPQALNDLLTILTEKGRVGDEFWIFLSEPTSYGYEPLESIAEKCEAFKAVAAAARAKGIRVGINPWPTFGAEESYQSVKMPYELPFRTMVGYDGKAAKRLVCPVSPEFLAYSKARYKLFAKTGCSFIWVDDDCRFTHLGGVNYPCFCEGCVRGFDGGKWADRETLVAALNAPENGELRRKWCAYGAERLARYCAAVREGVDEVDPAIETPFMSVGFSHTTFSGDYIEQCMKALRAKAARPGHGFYWDDKPSEFFDKVYDMARQITVMPDAVLDDVQYEEESCPCSPLNKAPESRMREMALSIWGGCTGVAMNHLINAGGKHPFGYLKYERDLLLPFRDFCDRYLDYAHDLPQSGLWAAFSEWAAAGQRVDEKGWFNEHDPRQDADAFTREWAGFGLAMTADPSHAWGTLLQGRTFEAFSDSEIEALFEKPLFMDGEALKLLWERGFGEKTGVKVVGEMHGGTEKLADSRYCGPYAGSTRAALFHAAYDLEPIAEGVEPLAYTERPYGTPDALCAAKYGNVVVLGYDPYEFTGTPGHQALMRGLFSALGAPVVMKPSDSDHLPRVGLWARADEKRAAVLLINAQPGSAPAFEVSFMGNVRRAEVLRPDGSAAPLYVNRGNGRAFVRVDTMAPWEMQVILMQP